MTIKLYTIQWHDWDVVVEIDHDILTGDKMHQINNFWTGADDRLADANDNITAAVLANLAARCFTLMIEYRYTVGGIIGLFSWTDHYNGGPQEGWPNMDGSDGIRLISVDEISFDPIDMHIKELKP